MTDRTLRETTDLEGVSFDDRGLVPVVSQDARTGQVLMVAWANLEALTRTLDSREMHFWSRTRQELWRKGETSGAFLRLHSLHADCDADTVLALVTPTGPACHTGEMACFGAASGPVDVLDELGEVIARRARERPPESYTTRLLTDRNERVKKLGEETAELVLALSEGDPDRITQESADLIYHLMVALEAAGSSLDRVRDELARRRP